jgi:hypothetical protein
MWFVEWFVAIFWNKKNSEKLADFLYPVLVHSQKILEG